MSPNTILQLFLLCFVKTASPYKEVGTCDAGWILGKDAMYCYKLFTTQVTWRNATAFCEQQGAWLCDLEDASEQQFVSDVVLQNATGEGAWLGANDMVREGDWRWVDNSVMQIRKFKWRPGNPDDGKFFLIRGLEDCLEIELLEYQGLLNDNKCFKEMQFICKSEAKMASTSKTTDAVTSLPVVPVSRKKTTKVASTSKTTDAVTSLSGGPSFTKKTLTSTSKTTDSLPVSEQAIGIAVGALFLVLLCVSVGVFIGRRMRRQSVPPLHEEAPGRNNQGPEHQRTSPKIASMHLYDSIKSGQGELSTSEYEQPVYEFVT